VGTGHAEAHRLCGAQVLSASNINIPAKFPDGLTKPNPIQGTIYANILHRFRVNPKGKRSPHPCRYRQQHQKLPTELKTTQPFTKKLSAIMEVTLLLLCRSIWLRNSRPFLWQLSSKLVTTKMTKPA
jgi:hypothetical protein